MATRIGTIYASVRAKTDHLQGDLNTAHRKINGAADRMRDSLNRINFRRIGIAATAAAGVATYALASISKEAIKLANVQEQAEGKLAAVLRATGNAAGFSIDQLKAMATQFQRTTIVGDEVVLSGMAILATFKNVREQAFERATAAAIDMAQVMSGSGQGGVSLSGAMVQLGKALNDPIQGVSALSRVGVTFTDQQKEMIRTLVTSNDIVGAQNIVLRELESQFGGVAEALGQTYAGAAEDASNAHGDMLEQLGFVVTKTQAFIELQHSLADIFDDVGDHIAQNREYYQSLAIDGLLVIVDSIGLAVEAIRFMSNAWDGLKVVAYTAIESIIVSIEVLYDSFRTLMTPLDLLFEGLVRLGAIENNPFTVLKNSIVDFRNSNRAAAAELITDIENSNARYDLWNDKIEDTKKAIKAVGTQSARTKQDVLKDLNVQINTQEELNKKKEEEAAITKAAAEKQLQTITNMYNEMKWEAEGYYNFREQKIDEEVTTAQSSGLSIEQAEQLKIFRLRQLNEEYVAHIKSSHYPDLKQAATDHAMDFAGVQIEMTADQQAALTEMETNTETSTGEIKSLWEALSTNYGNKDSGILGGLVSSWDGALDEQSKNTKKKVSTGNDSIESTWGAFSDWFGDDTKGLVKDLVTGFDSGISAHETRITDLDTFAQTTWLNIENKFLDMMGNIAAEKVMMYFEAAWTSGASEVISLLSKLLGWAFDEYVGGSGGSDALDLTGADMMNQGGMVRGSAPFSGDNVANDKVPVWLSPGEWVVPRSGVNKSTVPLLQQLTTGKKQGRGFGFDSLVSIATGGLSDVVDSDQPFYDFLHGLGMSEADLTGWYDAFLNPMSAPQDAYTAMESGDWGTVVDELFDPVTNPGITYILNTAGGYLGKHHPALLEFIATVLKGIAAAIAAIYSPAVGAGAWAAASGIISKLYERPNDEAVREAATVAATSYVASTAGGATGEFIGGAGGTVTSWGAQIAGQTGATLTGTFWEVMTYLARILAKKTGRYITTSVLDEAFDAAGFNMSSGFFENLQGLGNVNLSYQGSDSGNIYDILKDAGGIIGNYDYNGESIFHTGGRIGPREGLFLGKAGEEVVTEENIEKLKALVNGGSGRPLNVNVFIGDEEIKVRAVEWADDNRYEGARRAVERTEEGPRRMHHPRV